MRPDHSLPLGVIDAEDREAPARVEFPSDAGYGFAPKYWRAHRAEMRQWVHQELGGIGSDLPEDEAQIIAEFHAVKELQRPMRWAEKSLMRSCVLDLVVAWAALAKAGR
jgi:hypothetical protein